MAQLDGTTHSFIVKIWIEQPAKGSRAAIWQGLITHVPGGERCYFHDLEGIGTFMEPYLRAMGVKPSPTATYEADE
jgi:hypothetical protein